MYGHSSGAALVLHAAAGQLPIDKIVLHEPPFGSGSDEELRAEREEARQIAALLAQDRRGDAVAFFLASMGMPADIVGKLSHDPAMLANAPTITYDPFEVISEKSRGGKTPADQARSVAVPALVLAGGESPGWMIDSGRQIADALPNGRLRVLEGQGHVVPPEILAPVLTSSSPTDSASSPAENLGPGTATTGSLVLSWRLWRPVTWMDDGDPIQRRAIAGRRFDDGGNVLGAEPTNSTSQSPWRRRRLTFTLPGCGLRCCSRACLSPRRCCRELRCSKAW